MFAGYVALASQSPYPIEICPEMHALAKMAEMAINRQNRKTINKIQMRWQRGPLPSGDFGENGRNGN